MKRIYHMCMRVDRQEEFFGYKQTSSGSSSEDVKERSKTRSKLLTEGSDLSPTTADWLQVMTKKWFQDFGQGRGWIGLGRHWAPNFGSIPHHSLLFDRLLGSGCLLLSFTIRRCPFNSQCSNGKNVAWPFCHKGHSIFNNLSINYL